MATPEVQGDAVTSTEVTIVNQLGLHARAAARFVQLAGRFRAQVRVTRDGRAGRRQEHHGHPAARGRRAAR